MVQQSLKSFYHVANEDRDAMMAMNSEDAAPTTTSVFVVDRFPPQSQVPAAQIVTQVL